MYFTQVGGGFNTDRNSMCSSATIAYQKEYLKALVLLNMLFNIL